jgi:hypothetical protein
MRWKSVSEKDGIPVLLGWGDSLQSGHIMDRLKV